MLLRYVGVLLDGNLLISGIIISLLCYAGCVWLLYRLVRRDFDDALASRAVIYLAIGPLSFFLQAVYTESLFLLLSLACFVFAREAAGGSRASWACSPRSRAAPASCCSSLSPTTTTNAAAGSSARPTHTWPTCSWSSRACSSG